MSEQEIDTLRERWEADRSRLLTLELAGEYRRRGQLELAVEVLAAGLERHPEHAAARVAKGRCHLDLEQVDDAARELQQVAIEDPAHLEANRLLSEAHARRGDLSRARDRLGLFELLGGERAEIEALEEQIERAATPSEVAATPAPEPAPAGKPEPPVTAEPEPAQAGMSEAAAPPAPEPAPAVGSEASTPPPGVLATPPLEDFAPPAPEPELPAAGPFELASSASPGTRLDGVDSPGAAGRAPVAPRAADPDPFVLLDWIEFDEAGYAAALFAEGVFSPPTGSGERVGRSSETVAAAATAAAATASGEPAPTLTLAELYRKQGHREEAAGILRQILRRQPGNREAARALGELEKQGGWPLSAEDLLGGRAAGGADGSTADLLRRYRERLRGRD